MQDKTKLDLSLQKKAEYDENLRLIYNYIKGIDERLLHNERQMFIIVQELIKLEDVIKEQKEYKYFQDMSIKKYDVIDDSLAQLYQIIKTIAKDKDDISSNLNEINMRLITKSSDDIEQQQSINDIKKELETFAQKAMDKETARKGFMGGVSAGAIITFLIIVSQIVYYLLTGKSLDIK